jgi:hypothetical protein
MPITEETFAAFLRCESKSYLNLNGTVGVASEFSQSRDHLREEYKQTCREQLCSALRDGQWNAGTPALQFLEDRRYRLILDYAVILPEIHARLDALEQSCTASRGLNRPYIPIRFVPSDKVSMYDKLLLAFDANRFVPLGLTLLGPVLANILLFHLFMLPKTIGMGIFATLLWVLVACQHKAAFAGIFKAKLE